MSWSVTYNQGLKEQREKAKKRALQEERLRRLHPLVQFLLWIPVIACVSFIIWCFTLAL